MDRLAPQSLLDRSAAPADSRQAAKALCLRPEMVLLLLGATVPV